MFAFPSKSSKVDKAKPRLISLYSDIPQEEISLDDFESFALDRLKLLRVLEKDKMGTVDVRAARQDVKKLETKLMPLQGEDETKIKENQRKDVTSHFILRLAYCRTEDLRKWFLEREVQLLKLRLEIYPDEKSQLMADNGLQYETISDYEKQLMKDQLVGGWSDIDSQNFRDMRFYKVPFVEVLPLVSTRSVYLDRGFAFIPAQKFEQIIINKFRTALSKALTEASSMFDHVSDDPRIGSFMLHIDKQYIGKDYNNTQSIDKLTPDKVAQAAELNMPLCMKSLHDALKRDHKLKHEGRMQYGLFLKGAGLDLDGAINYFENEFTKIMSHEDFTKNYAYNIKHQYGKEGKRVAEGKGYNPYSCVKIFDKSPPAAGQTHGCPYKNIKMDGGAQRVASMLASLKITGKST